ncbi:MAG: sugar ABC transporter permease [Defluviitaleaceae bacterium]|nr:sugar ABC transporter permease [Defluviitaleaceae bacterium]MCL2273766.1 sugar ABC transporter permease [Defluviitaleaceae bacterium]
MKERNLFQKIFLPKPANHQKNTTWALMKQNKQSYALIAPYFILFFTFTVLPVMMAIGLSFTTFNMLQPPQFVGWNNYIRLFLENEVFMVALQNTLIIAVVAGPISYLLCFTFAWIINEMPPKIRAVMTVIFYAPSISGNVFFVWLWFFSGDRYGLVNGWLLRLGFIDQAINFFRDPRFILPLLLVVQVWLSLGVAFLAFIAGLQTVDKAMYEAGAMDGIRNRWQELWFITLPSMKPQMMFGAVMSITAAFSVGDISIQLAGFPSVAYAGETIVTHMQDFGWIRFEMGFASAIAVILFLMMVGTNKAIQRLLRKVGT